MTSMKSVLARVLENIKPSTREMKDMRAQLNAFLDKLKKEKTRLRLDATIFVGGSFAKNTVIKKDGYDVDIFVRYAQKYPDNDLSTLTKKLLSRFDHIEHIHGSRDYFRLKLANDLYAEIVPVRRVSSPKEAKNITDLSYSHVSFITKHVKTQKLRDEILLAKAFCFANRCYGAESYIKGFSGYALELLVYHYKSFVSFLRAMVNTKEKVVIDPARLHPSKKHVLLDVNSSKLESPVILIDPTYKHRNALAALSEQTFTRFQKAARAFLKRPTSTAFVLQSIDLEKEVASSKKKGYSYSVLHISTTKQKGDIAGSKLLKFFELLQKETAARYVLHKALFLYEQGHTATVFFSAKKGRERLARGPSIHRESHAARFKKQHKNVFVKNKRLYAKETIEPSLKKFHTWWLTHYAKKIEAMYIDTVRLA